MFLRIFWYQQVCFPWLFLNYFFRRLCVHLYIFSQIYWHFATLSFKPVGNHQATDLKCPSSIFYVMGYGQWRTIKVKKPGNWILHYFFCLGTKDGQFFIAYSNWKTWLLSIGGKNKKNPGFRFCRWWICS